MAKKSTVKKTTRKKSTSADTPEVKERMTAKTLLKKTKRRSKSTDNETSEPSNGNGTRKFHRTVEKPHVFHKYFYKDGVEHIQIVRKQSAARSNVRYKTVTHPDGSKEQFRVRD